METVADDDYALTSSDAKIAFDTPVLPYRPQDPKTYRPKIGLIGCGGITQAHLKAYKQAGYEVVMLCDLQREKAERRQQEFYPQALVTTDYKAILARPDIDVVDIATHPQERVPLIEAALNAKKHVLSQKPFVLDLATGEHLIRVARDNDVKLAVNQNGRYAPHVAYMREAIKAGLIGDVLSVHMGVHWNHSWVKDTPFEKIRDLVFYDFGIHWFDMLNCFLGERDVLQVFASRTRSQNQTVDPPLLAQALFTFDGGQATLVFDAGLDFGSRDTTYIGGTQGTLVSTGPDLGTQTVTLYTKAGNASPELVGKWFNDGFHGTMAELLCAIEEDREPQNGAQHNLKSLALCYAAIASATDNTPKIPGDVRKLPEGSAPGA